MVRWLEIRSRAHELRIGGEQRIELSQIARLDSGDGLVEFGVRRELRDATRCLDFVLERRPALEAVLASDDELRVGEREFGVEHVSR